MMNNVLTKKYLPNLTIEEFLPESKMFIEEYSCSLCEGILSESVIDQCGHSFCKVCLLNLLKETTKCPFTKHELSSSLSQNIIVNSVIEKQKVYCKNKGKGCQWIGKLSERKAHILSDCKKEIIDCQFSPTCPVQLSREEQDNHFAVCPFRLIDCVYCNAKIAFKEKESHDKVCPNIPVDCSNKCGKKVPLNKLQYHIETDCDNTVTECPFALVNCDFYDIRKQLKIHLNDDLERHLKLISNKMSSLEKRIDEQNVLIQTLCQENDNTKNDLALFKEETQASQNQLSNQLAQLENQMYTNMMYTTIPITNFIPNFFDRNGGDVFQLDNDSYVIIKSKENYGWYGISSEYLFQNTTNTMTQSQVGKDLMQSQMAKSMTQTQMGKSLMQNQLGKSLTQTQIGKGNVNTYEKQESNPILVINMKILSTKNSMIMFGITLSEKPSPLQNGYYHQTIDSERSYMFYCYNSSIYYKGIPNTENKEQQCVDGDIITMVLDTISNTLIFRRNGEVVNETISLPNLASMKVRAAIDLSQYGDSVIFLNR